jgi:hypothetical protein
LDEGALVDFEELPLDEPAKPAKPTRARKAAKSTKLVEAKPARKRSAWHELPANWQPDQASVEYGRSLRLSDQQIGFCLENLRNWSKSNGKKKIDWDAEFRKWLSTDAQRAMERSFGKRGVSVGLSEQFGV